jgi:hypothetical protein
MWNLVCKVYSPDAETTTTCINETCKHNNGWYGYVKFLGFKKRVFFCLDCSDFLYGKRLKKMDMSK